MKKNFIFVLLLTLVSVFNFSSCLCTIQNDDDDEQKTYEKKETNVSFISCRLHVGIVGKQTGNETLYESLESYLKANLSGLAEDVDVKYDELGFNIITITAKASNAKAVTNQLKAMNDDPSALTEMIKTNHPEVKSLSFSIASSTNTNDVVFSYSYKN